MASLDSAHKWTRRIRGCRLCWRITATVFLSILLIEILILIPSYFRERDRVVDGMQAQVRAAVTALATSGRLDDGDRAGMAMFIDEAPLSAIRLIGAGGETVMSLGRWPDSDGGPPDRLYFEWPIPYGETPLIGQARLDGDALASAMLGFVLRIAGLVMMIALFVTLATMLVLDRLVLRRLLVLRASLQQLREDPERPLDNRLPPIDGDELGEVFHDYNGMLMRLDEGLNEIRAQEQALRGINARLDERVRERTEALEIANRDLREQMAQREAAEQTIRSLARFPDENSSPVIRVNTDGKVLYRNQASLPLFQSWDVPAADHLPPHWRAVAEAALKRGSVNRVETTCGEHYFALGFTPVAEEGYVNVYGTDITERKRYEDELAAQSRQDRLTGLANRAALHDRLRQAIQRHQQFAVLTLDLDGFKEINGLAGHEVGDQVLREVAARLNALAAPQDVIARMGGDVFALARFDAIGVDSVAGLAEQVLESLHQPIQAGGRAWELGAGLGVALHPQDGETPDDLLKNADLAMYQAKAEGRDTYRFFIADMNQAVEARQRLVQSLRGAIGSEQIINYYQPQLDLRTGAVVGVEALVRWQHPERGLIPPGEFIPAAEQSGLITALGWQVLRQACRDIKQWRDEGLPVDRVAVNLSVVQLRDPGLADSVATVLAETGIPGEWLELEVTESLMMEDIERTICLLRELDALKVCLAVDDFGTGYSSLAYLKKLPIHKLKIDRAFVSDVDTDPQSASICDAIIQLGLALDLTVIAEGVEDEAQLRFLRGHGCHEMQGFLVSRPVPEMQLAEELRGGVYRERLGGELPVGW